MLAHCRQTNPVETYFSYKERVVTARLDKAKLILISIDETSLTDSDKKELKEKIVEMFNPK